jgi:hypothetical protein
MWKVEEKLRTERGIESRQKRKESKNMADQIQDAYIRAILGIIRNDNRAGSLVRLCRGGSDVSVFLNMFLDDFVAQNESRRVRLTAFCRLPKNRLTDLSSQSENLLLALQGDSTFSQTFSAYLPSTVVSSGSKDDSTRSRRRSRRRARWRRIEENQRGAYPND